MPELPEVETIVRDLRAAGLEGLRLERVRVFWPRSVAKSTPAAFSRALRGARIERLSRRGKYIVMDLGRGRRLLLHLRMTGQLKLVPSSRGRDLHEHVVLDLSDGRQLRFRDTRKFGRWELLACGAGGPIARLGPEPLDEALTTAGLADMLRRRRRLLKPLLLDQAFLAGLGNIYVDEALWEAGLHPLRRSDTLTVGEAEALHRAIRRVLTVSIGKRGTSLGAGKPNFRGPDGRHGTNQEALRVFRRAGQPCPRCGREIARMVVGQRSTHVCSACQPAPGARRARAAAARQAPPAASSSGRHSS